MIDIGANIGQWGYTLKSFFPHIQLYSFEPNKEIFPLLAMNKKYFNGWKIFDGGIGDSNNKYLYYAPEGSAEGSIYRNANHKKIPISLIALSESKRKRLALPDFMDLVKIDVEGAELETLKVLKDLTFRYLFIEISIKRRTGVQVEDVKKYFKGRASLLAVDAVIKNAQAGNALFLVNM